MQGECLPEALNSSFLQVLKSTGDVAAGRALYEGYAAVTDAPPECFLTLRDTVLLRKESRKLIVQPNTRLEGNGHHAMFFLIHPRPRTLVFSIVHTDTVRQQQEVLGGPTE